MAEIGYALSTEEHKPNQVGPDQRGFFEFYAQQVLPKLRTRAAA